MLQTSVNLENKIALVTGASSGIGRASARRLALAGATVVLSDKDIAGGEKVRHRMQRELRSKALFVPCDVKLEPEVEALWSRVIDAFGGVDILVNAAGITIRKDVSSLSLDEWNQVIAVNLTSIFLMARCGIPAMMRQGGGSIVNIASGWGLCGGLQAAAYCASKGGVVLLTKAMAIDHGPDGIRVNCVCPGDTNTQMLHEEARQLGTSHDALLDAARKRPLQRVGRPEEIAEVVLFLASDQSSFVTGEAIVVDGGGLAGSA